MGLNQPDITKRTEQYMQNFGFDETYLQPTSLAIGQDTTNNVLRRLQVNTSGQVRVSLGSGSGGGASVWLSLGLSLMP